MKIDKHLPGALCLATLIIVTGCGPSKTEREAKERERLALEERARRETEAGNKAITEMNKKLGRKPPALDLGAPSEKQPAPTLPPEKSSKP